MAINASSHRLQYQFGMTSQITVRLPTELVAFIDQRVRLGAARSRAAVVADALARARREEIAARDVEILTEGAGDDDELDSLAAYGARLKRDDLD